MFAVDWTDAGIAIPLAPTRLGRPNCTSSRSRPVRKQARFSRSKAWSSDSLGSARYQLFPTLRAILSFAVTRIACSYRTKSPR